MTPAGGLLRLATFRAEGFAGFAGTRQAFLNSLAPLLAFPLVGAALGALQGDGLAALGDLLSTIVALLGPAVFSHLLARRWGVEAAWLRYAVAFYWFQWAVPLAGFALLLVAGVAVRAGAPVWDAGAVWLLVLLGYGLALHFFLARRGLDLPRGRAVVLVLVVNTLTGLLVVGPRLLMPHTWPGWAPA